MFKNNGTSKSSILIGFSIVFTIHFGIPNFWTHPYIFIAARKKTHKKKTLDQLDLQVCWKSGEFLALVRLRPIVQTCQDVAILTNRNLVRFWGIQSRMLNLVTIRIIYCNFGFGDPELKPSLGGGFKYFLFSSLLGEDSHFD